MVTLFVIYLSFATGKILHWEHEVPASVCEAKAKEIRSNVHAGRVWTHCIKGKMR